jgi:acetolactate synthase-1/2/3 large subunit
VENTEMPVISTLLGLGVLPHKHPLNFGMLGMHGMAYANYAVHNADLIIGIGLRFDDRITGKIEEFAKDAQVIHIDIDPAEIGKNTIVDVPLIGDCKHVLKQLNAKIKKLSHKEWLTQIKKWNKKTDLKIVKKQLRSRPSKHLLAADIIKEINRVAKKDCIITSDVGQNQMWTAQYFNYNYPGQLLSSGGLGCMGYSLPASVGAQMAAPKKQVWALMGDGGFQMNIQELGAIMQEKLPIKIILFHNGYLGMVRQWQELFYQKNYSATKLINPDFVKIAKAYNIEAHRVATWTQTRKLIKHANQTNKTIFLEFIIGPEDNVYPMVPPGNTLNETVIGK